METLVWSLQETLETVVWSVQETVFWIRVVSNDDLRWEIVQDGTGKE